MHIKHRIEYAVSERTKMKSAVVVKGARKLEKTL